LNQINKDFENKIKLLENENSNFKKDFEKDKNNITEIKEELNYKNSVIKYLENLLKKTSINPKLYNEENYKNEVIRYNIKNNEKDINYLKEMKSNEYENEYIKNIKDDIIQNNQNINSLEKENQINLKNDNNNKKIEEDENIDEDEDIKENRPKQIKKEIDSLDQEIFELQKKLKKMLNK
jgi:hypothetical protein